MFIRLNQTLVLACPPGYTMVSGKCFKVYDTPKNYYEAQTVCHADGGRLAHVTNEAINDWISKQNDGYIWFAATATSHGSWVNDDGSALEWKNWYPGKPVGSDTFINCGLIKYDIKYGSKTGLWTDAACFKDHPFVCEGKP